MSQDREVMQQALEALENCTSEHGHRCNRCDSEIDEGGKVVAALRAALAQPPQPQAEPVGKVVAAVSGPSDAAMIQWTGEYRPTVGDLIYAAPPQQPAPGVQAQEPRFLFIAMDDDHRATLTYCADEEAVYNATRNAMFFVATGEELSAEHEEELRANVGELLENGCLTFEGDPPLYLYKLSAPGVQAQQAAAVGHVRIDSGEVHFVPKNRDAEFAGLVDGQPLYTAPGVHTSTAPQRGRLTDEQRNDPAMFTTPKQRGELAGDGKPCPNDHDPDCRWPDCMCRWRESNVTGAPA